ncbi:MAG: ribonuclease T [Immundisolibacterales bacterium]|nr:ribonuclease T [Immundisolibacterales bacterium]
MQARGHPIARRFRGFLPVVVDVETGGFRPETDALLEIAVVLLYRDESGTWSRRETRSCHVQPFPGANIEAKALEFNRIIPDHPLRAAKPEREALKHVCDPIRAQLKETGCTRAVLVGHNPAFDLSFVRAAAERAKYRRNPFHAFTVFDTATLGGLAYGQTVLAKMAAAAGLEWDAREAHSAIYDAEMTAEIFCRIVNRWDALAGSPPAA